MIKKPFFVFLFLLSCNLNAKSEDFSMRYSFEYNLSDESDIPLIDAVRLQNVESVKKFIANNVDLNAVDKNGNTALLKAIANNDEIITLILLEAGADPNKFGTFPAYKEIGAPLIISVNNNNIEITRMLLEYGAKSEKCLFLPYLCCLSVSNKIKDKLFFLINEYKNNKMDSIKYYNVFFKIFSDTICKNVEILKLLKRHDCFFEKGLPNFLTETLEQSLNSVTKNYRVSFHGSPLTFLIDLKNRIILYLFAMIKFAIDTGKVCDSKKVIKFTNKVKLALNEQINIFSRDLVPKNFINETLGEALYAAIYYRDIESIKILISNNINPDVELCFKDGTKMPLLNFIAKEEKIDDKLLDLVKFFMEYGANPDIKDSNGKSPYDYTNNKTFIDLLNKYKGYEPKETKNYDTNQAAIVNDVITEENLSDFITRYFSFVGTLYGFDSGKKEENKNNFFEKNHEIPALQFEPTLFL